MATSGRTSLKLEKPLLSTTAVTVCVSVLQLHGTLPGRPWIALFAFALYPTYRVQNTTSVLCDLVYLLLFGATIGGLLTYATPYPSGYVDVLRHYAVLKTSFTGSHFTPISSNLSFGFITEYTYTALLANFFDTSLLKIMHILPIVTVTITILAFYGWVARPNLSQNTAVFATGIFLLTWGVFRFLIEYRTLNLAFPMVVLLVGVHLTHHEGRISRIQILLFGGAAALTLATTHFTTMFIYLILGATFLTIGSLDRRKNTTVLLPVVGGLTWYLYMTAVNGGFRSLIHIGFYRVLRQSVTEGTGVSSGLSGATFGPIMMVLEWSVRLGFLIAGAALGFQWLRERKLEWTNLLVPTGVLGICTVAAAVGVFPILNAGRVLGFMAIFMPLIYVIGYQLLRRGSTKLVPARAKSKIPAQTTSVLLVALFCLLLLTTAVKLPPSIIGDPAPIRSDDVDHAAFNFISEEDLEVAAHIKTYLPRNASIQFRDTGTVLPLLLVDNSQSEATGYSSGVSYTSEGCDSNHSVYTTGKHSMCIKSNPG